ncbi:hypothetical protein [Amycolatopsis benzoatilytica]|nr:hypothetical protein [Amycolatopsis benzoatilytica]
MPRVETTSLTAPATSASIVTSAVMLMALAEMGQSCSPKWAS